MTCPMCHKWLFVITCLALPACTAQDDSARLLTDLGSDDVATRRAAAAEAGRLKPSLPEIRSALQSAVDDPDADVRRLACVALGEIGGADVDVLTRALADAEMSVRLAAAFALLKTSPGSQPAIDVLTRAMQQGEGGVIVAVTGDGPRAAWAVPTLTLLLNDKRPGIRRLAAEGLGKIGPASQPALPALQAALKDPDDRVRNAAENAIDAIQPAGNR